MRTFKPKISIKSIFLYLLIILPIHKCAREEIKYWRPDNPKVIDKVNKLLNDAKYNTVLERFNAFTDIRTRKLLFYQWAKPDDVEHTLVFERPSGNSVNYLCVLVIENQYANVMVMLENKPTRSDACFVCGMRTGKAQN